MNIRYWCRTTRAIPIGVGKLTRVKINEYSLISKHMSYSHLMTNIQLCKRRLKYMEWINEAIFQFSETFQMKQSTCKPLDG